MTPPAIRPARPADAGAIAAFATQLGYPSSAEDVRGRMEALEPDASSALLVAEHDGKVVGWVTVREQLTIESGAHAEITGLVIDEAHRGRGIGEALAAAAETWARQRGHRRLRVRSNVVRERAHRFYERLGFAVTKRQVVLDKPLD